MGDNTSPISVILVSSGSRGNKLLFRYPFQRSQEHPASQTSKPRSRYAVNSTGEHAEDQDGDPRFSDVILATILATKSEMCGQKFELKIDNVRFVGHPTLLQHTLGQVSKTDPSPKREAPTMILFNVVFALRVCCHGGVLLVNVDLLGARVSPAPGQGLAKEPGCGPLLRAMPADKQEGRPSGGSNRGHHLSPSSHLHPEMTQPPCWLLGR